MSANAPAPVSMWCPWINEYVEFVSTDDNTMMASISGRSLGPYDYIGPKTPVTIVLSYVATPHGDEYNVVAIQPRPRFTVSVSGVMSITSVRDLVDDLSSIFDD